MVAAGPDVGCARARTSLMTDISIRVHGRVRRAHVEPRLLLVHYLREHLNLTGTHVGCDTSQCGACTVLIDGRSAKSCTVFAVQADGSEVTTIEGLATNGTPHPVQAAWAEISVPQCGYCQSGQIMAAAALLAKRRNPSDREIEAAMADNLCRCGTYRRIKQGIRRAVELMQRA